MYSSGNHGPAPHRSDLLGFEVQYQLYHSFEIDLTRNEDDLFAKMTSACRRCIRKADKEGSRSRKRMISVSPMIIMLSSRMSLQSKDSCPRMASSEYGNSLHILIQLETFSCFGLAIEVVGALPQGFFRIRTV